MTPVDPAGPTTSGGIGDPPSGPVAGLRRIDDLPLYELRFAGDYDMLAPPVTVTVPSPFGCSLFAAYGDPGRPLFARNFDWETHPALLVHTAPPGRYASVSMVDIGYLGLALTDDPTRDAAARQQLELAPLLPFDGMNERGLAVGLAEDSSATAHADPGKPTVSGVRIIRLMLDQAATVAEALDVLDQYNIDFGTESALHYLLADASGTSAVVEFVDGRMRVLPGGPRWQALTNIRLAGVDETARRRDRRYAVAAQVLDAAGGVVNAEQAMRLLGAVAQDHTRWSVTYDLITGAVRLATRKRFETVHEFALPLSR